MKQYLDVLRDVREHGVVAENRTATDTIGVFGRQMRFDLGAGFPLLTTKKLFLKGIIVELIWIIRGETNISYLKDRGVKIWDEWADEKGDLGPVYGKQWRHWRASNGREIDQLSEVFERIKKSVASGRKDRRLIVSAWNPEDVPCMAIPPCHSLFQFEAANGKLSCHLFQRSCDMFLGVPFNIASYSLLTMLLAKAAGLQAGEFVHTLSDAHIYVNHLAQVDLQLSREPRGLPQLHILKDVKTIQDLESLEYTDFKLEGYDPHPHIKGEVAV